MSVKVRLKMKSCNLICEILLKQDFYLFQFKIANLFRNYLLFITYRGRTLKLKVAIVQKYITILHLRSDVVRVY